MKTENNPQEVNLNKANDNNSNTCDNQLANQDRITNCVTGVTPPSPSPSPSPLTTPIDNNDPCKKT